MIGPSRAAVRDEMMDWLGKEWDYPEHSDCSRDSAIMGSVDECVEQLKAHLAAGVQKIIFVPYKYEMDQVETIAREIIPRLKKVSMSRAQRWTPGSKCAPTAALGQSLACLLFGPLLTSYK